MNFTSEHVGRVIGVMGTACSTPNCVWVFRLYAASGWERADQLSEEIGWKSDNSAAQDESISRNNNQVNP